MPRDLKISVVTCSYNQAEYLERTINSVLGQNYSNLEYIIIDGASDDASVEIIKKYKNRLAYWISEPDEGQTDALIKGFNRASGEILCWLNSDDLFEMSTLKEVNDFFQKNPGAQVVFGDATWMDRNDQTIKKKKEHAFNKFIWLNAYNYIPQPSTFWRKEIYKNVGGLNPSFNLAMDADLWIRFSEKTKIHHVKRPWSRMRLYPDQKNQRLRTESNREDRIIRDRYFPNRSLLLEKGLKIAARGLRVGLKVKNGCYW